MYVMTKGNFNQAKVHQYAKEQIEQVIFKYNINSLTRVNILVEGKEEQVKVKYSFHGACNFVINEGFFESGFSAINSAVKKIEKRLERFNNKRKANKRRRSYSPRNIMSLKHLFAASAAASSSSA
jgi:ribosome-associated translation inhibitor RaiA